MALAALHGVDPWPMARSGDPAEAMLARVLTERVVELGAERDERLARFIVNTLAEAMRPGRG